MHNMYTNMQAGTHYIETDIPLIWMRLTLGVEKGTPALVIPVSSLSLLAVFRNFTAAKFSLLAKPAIADAAKFFLPV